MVLIWGDSDIKYIKEIDYYIKVLDFLCCEVYFSSVRKNVYHIIWRFLYKSVIIHFNEYMKGHSLSQFQKDQYASYLESQLEKFSSFMLMQRKQNDKYRQIEEMIMQHQNSINQIRGKIELIEVYQHQNLQNCELINKKINKFEGLEQQIQRIQDRCRIAFGQEAKYTNHIHDSDKMKQEAIKEMDHRISKMQKSQNDLSKKLKAVEQEIDRNKDLIVGICKSKSFIQSQQADTFANHKDLKKLQKKMHRYFDEKFGEIEQILKKSNRKRSKSPAYRTPIQFVNTYSSAQQTQKLLSQFKINETSNMKSQISTLSRETKHTPNESRSIAEVFKKEKRQKEKGKSKSKSQSKSKSKKYLDQSISRSKNDFSAKKSDISRSKSPKPSKNLSKKSVQKSRQSSLSCKKGEKQKEMKEIARKKSKKCPESCGTRYV